MTTSVSLDQKDPVHFRVREVIPNPLKTPHSTDELVLSIGFVKGGGTNFGVPASSLAPYRDALNDAIDSEAVYWVDWDYSKDPTFPPRRNDSTLERLLRAVQNRQIVPRAGEDGDS